VVLEERFFHTWTAEDQERSDQLKEHRRTGRPIPQWVKPGQMWARLPAPGEVEGRVLVIDRVAKTIFHIPGIGRVQTITRPLFSALAESLKGVSLFGGGGSSSSSGASGTPFGFSFGGNKASGGPVLGGNWYNVGENGPERLYMPQGTSGTIVPNGGGITYQQTVVIQSPTDGAVIRAAVVSGAAMARSEIARMGRIGAMS
jgi:hypothetical protein